MGVRARCPHDSRRDGGATNHKPEAWLTEKSRTAPDSSAGVPPAVEGASLSLPGNTRPRGPLWATLTATFFGIGRIHPGPGTWASAATVLFWAAARLAAPPTLRTPAAMALASRDSRRHSRSYSGCARGSAIKDPQFVVIDEVAGQLIALIAVPLAWKTFLAGFILFRAFDIVKPPPVRQLEGLPEGAGIMLDDVAAGLYAFMGFASLVLTFVY